MHRAVLATIPFRAEPAVSAGQVAWVIFVAAVLLLVTFLILLQAKKAGWLSRLLARGGPVSAVTARHQWTVDSQRVGGGLLVHTLERPGQMLVLVESRTGVTVTSLPAAGPAPAVSEP